MKQNAKYVGLGFFGCALFSFTLSFVSHFVDFIDLIQDKSGGFWWVQWLIGLLGVFACIAVAGLGLLKIVLHLKNDDTYCPLLTVGVPATIAIFNFLQILITMIYFGVKGYNIASEYIVIFIFDIGIITLAILQNFLKSLSKLVKTILILAVFLLAFIVLCMSFGQGFGLAISLFLLFAFIAGIVYVVFNNLDAFQGKE